MKRTKRVVIYLRISEDREEQQSIGNQERECRTYAQQKGWEVVSIQSDIGKSGYKEGVRRPGFDAAMAMVESRQADIFLVWKVSRFIRQIRQFHLFLDRLLKAGGSFDSVTDPVDYMTASGELLLAMTAGFAQMESAAKADFARSWNMGRTGRGACPQGPRPFGYDRVPKAAAREVGGQKVTLVPNREEAAILVDAAQGLLEGKSLKAIMRELDALPGTRGVPLTSRGLRSALMTPTVAGLRATRAVDDLNPNRTVLTGDFVEGCWEAILPREAWTQVCALLADPSRRNGPGNQLTHLLSGIVVCGTDGCPGKLGVRRWKQHGKEGWRYACFTCYNSAGKEVLDAAAKARVLEVIDQKAWVSLKERGRGFDPAVVKAIEDEGMALTQMWKSKQITLAQFQVMNEELTQRLAQATGTQPLDLPAVKNLAKSWDTMQVADQRKVLTQAFSVIKLDPANGTRDTLSRFHLKRAS